MTFLLPRILMLDRSFMYACYSGGTGGFDSACSPSRLDTSVTPFAIGTTLTRQISTFPTIPQMTIPTSLVVDPEVCDRGAIAWDICVQRR